MAATVLLFSAAMSIVAKWSPLVKVSGEPER